MKELLDDMQGFIYERTIKAMEGDVTYKQDTETHHDLYKKLGAALSDNPEAKRIWFDIDGAHNVSEASAACVAYTQGFFDGLKLR